MRILTLRFANLNSLLGEWEIDFTHPAYDDAGLFAITGPTGAGKTTILDALCLALFGRTPRLERVNKSANELMSRQAGECFAEVSFLSGAGQFRCHWQQHRARRRRDGELQPPRHEIADAATGELLAVGVRDVAAAVESATGMDYLRFTRSMLLAQGGFAAFLQAAPDQRAPLLEQITGTAIYSAISMAVHDRRAAERGRLQQQQLALDALQALSPEEEARLRADLARETAAEKPIAAQMLRQRECIAWRERLEELEAQRRELLATAQDLDRERAAFAPQLERLARAQRALELDAAHASLIALRQAQAHDRRALETAQARLPALEESQEAAQHQERTAIAQRDLAKSRQFEQQPLLREVRALDQQLAALMERRGELRSALEGDARALQALQADQSATELRLRDCEDALRALRADRQQGRVDARLVDELGVLRQRADALAATAQERGTREADRRSAELQLSQARAGREAQAQRLEQLEHDLVTAEASLHLVQAKLEALLEGQGMAHWRRRQTELGEEQRRCVRLCEAIDDFERQRREGQRLGERERELRAELATIESAIQAERQRQAAVEEKLTLLETQWHLQQRIESLEAERQHLKAGEPCPLCGATEHPFGQAGLPRHEKTRQALDSVRAERRAIGERLDGQRERRASLQALLTEVESAAVERSATFATARRLAERLLASAALDAGPALDDPQIAESLQRQRHRLQAQLVAIDDCLQEAEALEVDVQSLQARRSEQQSQLANARMQLAADEHAEERAAAAQRRSAEELARLQQRERAQLAELQECLSDFGGAALEGDGIASFLSTLNERRDRWLQNEQRLNELERELAALTATRHNQAEQRERRLVERRAREDDLNGLEEALQLQQTRRAELLGDRSVDAEESRLSAAVDGADRALVEARRRAAESLRALGELRSRLANLEPGLRERERSLESEQRRFSAQLKRLDFSDEAAYCAARMTADDREHLVERRDALASRSSAVAAQQRERDSALADERQRSLTEAPLDGLRQALGQLLEEQGRLQKAIGALQQRLDDNARTRDRQRECLAALRGQQEECRRWDDLHALIGSADGKKYRNFAQGLTFELMVGHANHQLQRMSDRYLLLHDPEQPLELSVVDNYQGGELRSTKNLSGGESFIISLALALGLSGMASRRLRVDSLYLDEGFGTLDEEALDTALETLASLQRDGKTIGVISHVPMLKERIATQIRVSPLSGGRSVISGPGCRRAGEEDTPVLASAV